MQITRKRLRRTSLGRLWGSIKSTRDTLLWQYSSRGQDNRERLEQYHNNHKGERAFIIGNGPSINQTNLAFLKDEWTFATNRFYLKFDQDPFRPRYYVVINTHVIAQFMPEIARLPFPKFLPWKQRHNIPAQADIMLYPESRKLGFSSNPAQGLFPGHTVTFVCMQLAYYMGFQTVYLIGVDHYFATKGEANKLVTSEGADPNHFDPNYFGKGIQWNLPDLESSEAAYGQAKTVYEADGRAIYDATIGGHLEIFPKVDYTSLFRI